MDTKHIVCIILIVAFFLLLFLFNRNHFIEKMDDVYSKCPPYGIMGRIREQCKDPNPNIYYNTNVKTCNDCGIYR